MAAASSPASGARERNEEERQAKLARAEEDVRQIVAEFHARSPSRPGQPIGAAYARYSTKHQDSVADQIRAIFADAARKGVSIPLGHVFFDLGVRGCKNERAGLNALRECLGAKRAQVAFFFATNRLFRKTYRSLQFVEEEIVDRGLRGVFVKSGVDTADERRWRSLLTMNAMMDELVVGSSGEHIRAAHEGLIEKGFVCGPIAYGYAGEPVPRAVTRRGLPRTVLVPDPVTAGVVRRVFGWFVHDRLTVMEIVRRLNDDTDIPLPPRSKTGAWTREVVARVLRNPLYRGWLRYGVTESVWVSSKDYARKKRRPEPLKEQQVENLRLVPDSDWHAAQVLIREEAAKVVGRKPRDENASFLPRVLNGLFRCPVHDRRLYVGGGGGKYLVCKACLGVSAPARPLYSQLPRALAVRMTCEALAAAVRRDGELVERVIVGCRVAAESFQEIDPHPADELRTRIDRLDRQIKFVLRNSGETDADRAEAEVELRRMRRERDDIRAMLAAANAPADVAIPSDAEVRALVADMGRILTGLAGGTDADARQVRVLIDRLTGGRIDLEQIGERRAKRGWLRGRFRLRLAAAVHPAAAVDDAPVVVIDYRDDGPALPDEFIADVKQMYDEGLLLRVIATRLGVHRNRVMDALDAWYARRGEERPDGRGRRTILTTKQATVPQYVAIADRVKDLSDSGRSFAEIETSRGWTDAMVRAAWRHWHTSRGLPVPDGRAVRKARRPAAQQAPPVAPDSVDATGGRPPPEQ
ncbi:recombinase family protein [Fimbriiglobus ruber]|uniref:DNA invertase n=1 Tax=Fimbriiglobus ruber TaxID=1908690 RepID=A0A225D4U6_9BACT|nr:recombinase family protein [Fimbriiglobus ruber]OWK34664.1 DNA invertase [Fimbriiglobus ruber]